MAFNDIRGMCTQLHTEAIANQSHRSFIDNCYFDGIHGLQNDCIVWLYNLYCIPHRYKNIDERHEITTAQRGRRSKSK